MLKKRKIDLSIMESTDQITADKMSIRPSEIINLRYSKNKEAKKRTGLNRYVSLSNQKALGELNGSGYVYTTSGVYGINDLDEGVDLVTRAPFDNWGVSKLSLSSGNGAIEQVALARGENYFFYGYNIDYNASASGNDITNTYLLDDNFNVVRTLSNIAANARATSIRAVSYDKAGVRYVDFVYISSPELLKIARYDEDGDFVTFVTPYNLATIVLLGGLEVTESHDGDGYWVAATDNSTGSYKIRLARYTASTDSWSSVVDTTVINNYEVPTSIVAFSDKVVVTTGTIQDATGVYGQARVWVFDVTSFPTAPKTILTYALAGYDPNYAVATKVDDTYYMLSINEWQTSSGSTAGNVDIMTRILRASKTATSVTSASYLRIGRTTAIGQCIIDGVFFYQVVMCQNGYYPLYYLIRGLITSPTSVVVLCHFLPARAPIYPAYYNGTPGDNDYTVNSQQALMKVQPYMIPFNGSWYTYLPVQSVGENNASWQSIKITKDVPVKTYNVKGIAAISKGSLGFFDGVKALGGAVKYPEIVKHTGGAAGSFSYAWVAVVKRTDGAGNVVRGLPSPPRVVTGLAAAGVSSIVTLNFSPKALLWEDATSLNKYSDSVVEIYRTEANGTVFYKEGESNAITFQSAMDDATLIGRELLYTTGDTLANVYPPSANDITYSMGRVWVIGDDDTIYYSKELYSGQAIEFNDGLLYRIDGGRNTSIARSGKRVIVFKERQTFMIWGTPANNIGLGEALDHQEISSSIGAVSPVATVETEVGVIFESHKGLYIVRPNNAIEFVGADVIDYTTNANITSSTHIEDLNEAAFTLDDGKVLIYNYLFGIWQVIENSLGASFIAASRIGNRDIYASAAGYIYKSKLPSDANPYQDESSNYKVRYSTGWLKVSDVGGFQRCYRLYVLGGKATTAQDIIIKVYNDYDDVTPTQTKTFAIAAGDPLNFELHVKQQKCESIRFTLEEDTNVNNGYLELNGLSIQVGIKQGFNKLSPDLRR